MVIACWSAKGGAGTTVVAAGIALALARCAGPPAEGSRPSAAEARPPRPVIGIPPGPSAGVLLVDTERDLPLVLGMPRRSAPGLGDWLASGPDVPVDGLARLEVAVQPGVALIERGAAVPDDIDRAEVLAAVLATDPRHVVIDCGSLGASDPGPGQRVRQVLAASAACSVLVTRSCYLALRRATEVPVTPTGFVLIEEPGRTLREREVSEVVRAPALAAVPWDAAVARAVDSGLLASRLPRLLRRGLTTAP